MKSVALFGALCLSIAHVSSAPGQTGSSPFTVTAALEVSPSAHAQPTSSHLPPAVLWLLPVGDPHPPVFVPHPGYVLLQKNKMFSPHLLVVPVGASVAFPNRDPFFHNVFSLFNGRRFDLGLYESGKTEYVTFSREGVSYIFCNIHPEMSAVVISLTTPLFSVADRDGQFTLPSVREGDYEVHLWVEGQSQTVMDGWIKRVHLSASHPSLGPFAVSAVTSAGSHTNKFGQPYTPKPTTSY